MCDMSPMELLLRLLLLLLATVHINTSNATVMTLASSWYGLLLLLLLTFLHDPGSEQYYDVGPGGFCSISGGGRPQSMKLFRTSLRMVLITWSFGPNQIQPDTISLSLVGLLCFRA